MKPLRKPTRQGLFASLCILFLLPIGNAAHAADKPRQRLAVQAMDAQRAIESYQRQVSSLQRGIEKTEQELQSLRRSRDRASAAALGQNKTFYAARNKFQRNRAELALSELEDAGARLQHAEFELFLVERQRSKAQKDVHSIDVMINEKIRFLAESRRLLQRKQQAMVGQHQLIRKLEKQFSARQQLASS